MYIVHGMCIIIKVHDETELELNSIYRYKGKKIKYIFYGVKKNGSMVPYIGPIFFQASIWNPQIVNCGL